MRFIIALLLILGLNNFIYSQNCYVILADLTGVDMPSHESSLEAAALDLKNAFPPENQLQFKVFDYGFYSMNEYTQGGFQGVWDKVITDVTSMSTYFLVFGRQLPNSHGTSKVWIDFKLPNAELFDCIEEAEEMNHLKIRIQSLGESNPNAFEFAQIEIEVMQFLQKKISCEEICDNGIDDDKDGWIDCNDPDCIEQQRLRGKSRTICVGEAVFRENSNQNFGFDDNKIESYPTYNTPLGEGIPWKSLGLGVQDQVNVEFSDQLILSDLTYVATGVEIIGSTTPQDYNETITIIGNSLTENAKIEVKDIDGVTIGGLMVKSYLQNQ